MAMKFFVIAIVFLGEALIIFSEMRGARTYSLHETSFVKIFLGAALLAMVGSAFTVGGYMLGLQSFRNIWIVSAVAVTSIVILEPVMAYTVVGQLPTPGALAGFGFGTVGLICALFW